MADYPTYPQLVTSKRVSDDGTIVERSESGKPRLRSYYTTVRYAFQVDHEVDSTEKDAILSHYAGDRTNVFSFTWKGDSQSYNVRYAGPPMEQVLPGADRWKVTVYLIVV